MSIAVAVLSYVLIKGTPESRMSDTGAQRFDWSGFIAFIIAMVAVNLVIGQGSALGWLSPVVIGLSIVFAVAAVVFQGGIGQPCRLRRSVAISKQELQRSNSLQFPAQWRGRDAAGCRSP